MHSPELHKEWIENWSVADQAAARRHLQRHGVMVPSDARTATIGPLNIRQLNLFSYKLALGLYFEHFRIPLRNAGRISAIWRTAEDFSRKGIPPLLLDMMQRYGTLQQGKWNERETFEYRYEVNENDGLFACLAKLRGRFFIAGFAVTDPDLMVDDPEGWIKPCDLLDIVDAPGFNIRL
jgi:hypothetical protein